MKYYGILAVVLLTLVLFGGCSENPEQPKAGTVSALVFDPMVGPVADVEVTLTPFNIVAKTDRDGLAVFTVPAGDYFVNANVCCIGPGWIDYHIPVTVRAGQTVEIEMQACLVCV